jgi:protein-tyrosine phosphatase
MAEFTILTVCTGNICRSPLAQQLLETGVQSLGGVTVSSAGTGALVGQPMTDQAQAIAREFGVADPSTHVARALTVEQLRDADLVLALSREHRKAIVEMLPRGARHTFTLRELARLLSDVDEDEYERLDGLPAGDLGGRLRELVEIAASRRGAVLPPSSPDDDDVLDPYRRDDAAYRTSAEQVVPAIAVLLAQFERSLAATA